jgi:hypothetical protein
MRVVILDKHGNKKIVNLNRRKAIREFCLQCVGWSASEVDNCTMPECPLYPYRSGAGKQNAKERQKAISNHCARCMNGSHVSECNNQTCPLWNFRGTRKRVIKLGSKKQKSG